MKRYLTLVFALMLCLLLGVGTFLSAPPASAQGTSRILGRVIDAGTGLGVSGAHVEVILYKSLPGYHQFYAWADTNADGYYTTSGIPTGQYAVRVQATLGKTKLEYFGAERIKVMPSVNEKLVKPFLNIFFTSRPIVRAALIMEHDTDDKGRKYISCMLFKKTFDKFGPEETFGDAEVGSVALYDDGTFLSQE